MKELRQEGKMGQIPDYSPTMKPEFPIKLVDKLNSAAWQKLGSMRAGGPTKRDLAFPQAAGDQELAKGLVPVPVATSCQAERPASSRL